MLLYILPNFINEIKTYFKIFCYFGDNEICHTKFPLFRNIYQINISN